MIKTIIVDSSTSIRLDRYLRRVFPLLTQGVIENAIRKSKVKVNNCKIKSSHRLKQDDEILIFSDIFDNYKLDQNNNKKSFSTSIISLANKITSEYLLLSTKEFIAINKPFGLAVQGGSKIKTSIDDALSYLNYTTGSNYKLVHRLDKDTSGVLLIANGYEAATEIGNAFKKKIIEKTYIAVLSGILKNKEGRIYNQLAKDKFGTYELVKEQNAGKYAETFYKVLKENNNLSLVEFKPTTGRMHQLRVHSKLLGHPIVGDSKYDGIGYERMLLHAMELIIPAEVFGKKITITAEEDFKSMFTS